MITILNPNALKKSSRNLNASRKSLKNEKYHNSQKPVTPVDITWLYIGTSSRVISQPHGI
jgi:hypothetical protein